MHENCSKPNFLTSLQPHLKTRTNLLKQLELQRHVHKKHRKLEILSAPIKICTHENVQCHRRTFFLTQTNYNAKDRTV